MVDLDAFLDRYAILDGEIPPLVIDHVKSYWAIRRPPLGVMPGWREPFQHESTSTHFGD
jgi:hypothetical protein